MKENLCMLTSQTEIEQYYNLLQKNNQILEPQLKYQNKMEGT